MNTWRDGSPRTSMFLSHKNIGHLEGAPHKPILMGKAADHYGYNNKLLNGMILQAPSNSSK